MRRESVTFLALGIAFVVLTPTVRANLYQWSNATGSPSVQADLSISGDTLTVVLRNTSSVASAAPIDVLSSFYFDIVKNGVRPTLTYVSATTVYNSGTGLGGVYLTKKTQPDTLQTGVTNIMVGAVFSSQGGGNKSDGWEFKVMDPALNPFLGFGIGTVGNNTPPGSLYPNSFNGSLVNGLDYSIYAGDVASQNLNGRFLVKGTATFTFGGLTGYTNDDLGDVGFGFGTGPDSFQIVPAPAGVLLGFLGLAVAGLKLRRVV